MDSNSDEDSNLTTRGLFNGYFSRFNSTNINEESDYNEMHGTMSAFDNDDHSYMDRKRKMYDHSSSSDDNNDQQYDTDSLKYDEINISDYNKSMHQHTAKKRKTDSGSAISNIEETYTQDLADIANGTYDDHDEGKGNLSHSSSTVQRMMKKMGYKPGKGLGKDDQGRVEPVVTVAQHGRRGLGHFAPGLKEASLKWKPEDEEIKAIEDIEWLPNVHRTVLASEDMTEWITLGPKKQTIDDETTFCNPEILEQIIRSKTIFDKLDRVEMRKARTRSNPYETIRTVNFLNRAAVKMANINRACNFMFTNSKDVNADGLLYFADVCAGPGGFSEYILSKKNWHAKGFGFTLRNENDFTLDEFFAGPCETFHPFYGTKGDGDVFNPQNQEEFRSMVMKHTNDKGVHFMMSDGGFSVEGQENIQEILSKQLYLCQCLVALMIVRPGGHFVTKLFDLFTPFSAGLVYLMYRCFDSVCIFKPNSSRPANSERYLICKRKKPDTLAVTAYLSQVNNLLLNGNDNNDVIELVPLEVLEEDQAFVTYLRSSNDTLGRKQIIGLLKIAAYCEDPTLIEQKQADMRKECLKYWELDDKTRVRPHIGKPQDKIWGILKSSTESFLGYEATKLKSDNVKSTIMNQPYDWYCMPCGSGPYVEEDKVATFYMGLGRQKVYRYTKGRKWISIADVNVELPANTLVYAELLYETKRTGKFFSKTRALHILDAYMLGGEDVSKLYISHRYMLTKKFCDALWKPAPNNYACVRAKERFFLTPDIDKKLQVTQRRVKLPIAFEATKNALELDDANDMEPVYFPFNSVLFLRSIARPWSRHISQKTNQYYVYNQDTKKAEYENNRPRDAEANFMQAFEERVVWNWPHDGTLNMDTVAQMMKSTTQKT